MNITVYIERLVLDGIDIPPGKRRPDVPSGTIQLESGNDAAHLGSQIARPVYGGIGR